MLKNEKAAPGVGSRTRPRIESRTPSNSLARPSHQAFSRGNWLHPDPLADDDAFVEPLLFRVRIIPEAPAPVLYDGGTTPRAVLDWLAFATGRDHDAAIIESESLFDLGEDLSFTVFRTSTVEALFAKFLGVRASPLIWRGAR